MTNANAVLYPSTESTAESDLPTLVWRQRTLRIPHAPYSARGAVQRPFPLDPVIDLCVEGRLTGTQAVRNGVELRPEGTIIRTAEVLDVDRQRVYRWTRTGLTAEQADVIAIMFGLHPCLIWTDWFAHAPSDEEVELARKRCARVVPSSPMEHRLAELRREGSSFRQIARTLTEEGWRTRAGNRTWSSQVVQNTFRAIKRDVAA